jgi:hypothetical protein
MPAAHKRICYNPSAIMKPADQLMAEDKRWTPEGAVPQKS